MPVSNSTTLKQYLNSLDKLENSVTSLYWSVYSLNMNFNDIMTDRFDSEEGIDKSRSYYIFDSVNRSISRPSLTNLVIVTKPWESSELNPTSMYCIVELECQSSIQFGLDVLIQFSTNDGLNYIEVSPLSIFKEVGFVKYIRGTLSGLTRYNTGIIRTKITCASQKGIKLKALATGVRFSL
jgi:hypothetical protein